MKTEKLINKLIKIFKTKNPFNKESFDEIESEKIELDNLDYAYLVYDENGNVLVENEHCSRFEVNELSNEELKIFIYIL